MIWSWSILELSGQSRGHLARWSVSGSWILSKTPLPHLPTGMPGIPFIITWTLLSFPANEFYEVDLTTPPFNHFSRYPFILVLVEISHLFSILKFIFPSPLSGSFSLSQQLCKELVQKRKYLVLVRVLLLLFSGPNKPIWQSKKKKVPSRCVRFFNHNHIFRKI